MPDEKVTTEEPGQARETIGEWKTEQCLKLAVSSTPEQYVNTIVEANFELCVESVLEAIHEQLVESTSEPTFEECVEMVVESSPHQSRGSITESAPEQNLDVVIESNPENCIECMTDPAPQECIGSITESTFSQCMSTVVETMHEKGLECILESFPAQNVNTVLEAIPENCVEIMEELTPQQCVESTVEYTLRKCVNNLVEPQSEKGMESIVRSIPEQNVNTIVESIPGNCVETIGESNPEQCMKSVVESNFSHSVNTFVESKTGETRQSAVKLVHEQYVDTVIELHPDQNLESTVDFLHKNFVKILVESSSDQATKSTNDVKRFRHELIDTKIDSTEEESVVSASKPTYEECVELDMKAASQDLPVEALLLGCVELPDELPDSKEPAEPQAEVRSGHSSEGSSNASQVPTDDHLGTAYRQSLFDVLPFGDSLLADKTELNVSCATHNPYRCAEQSLVEQPVVMEPSIGFVNIVEFNSNAFTDQSSALTSEAEDSESGVKTNPSDDKQTMMDGYFSDKDDYSLVSHTEELKQYLVEVFALMVEVLPCQEYVQALEAWSNSYLEYGVAFVTFHEFRLMTTASSVIKFAPAVHILLSEHKVQGGQNSAEVRTPVVQFFSARSEESIKAPDACHIGQVSNSTVSPNHVSHPEVSCDGNRHAFDVKMNSGSTSETSNVEPSICFSETDIASGLTEESLLQCHNYNETLHVDKEYESDGVSSLLDNSNGIVKVPHIFESLAAVKSPLNIESNSDREVFCTSEVLAACEEHSVEDTPASIIKSYTIDQADFEGESFHEDTCVELETSTVVESAPSAVPKSHTEYGTEPSDLKTGSNLEVTSAAEQSQGVDNVSSEAYSCCVQ